MKKIISKIQTIFPLLPNIFSAFFSRPETDNYPFEKTFIPERYRGRVSIREENCVGCSLCVLDCPAAALELKKESKQKFRLLHFRDRCTYCGQCEFSCRFNAIYLDNVYIQPSDNKEAFLTVLVDRDA